MYIARLLLVVSLIAMPIAAAANLTSGVSVHALQTTCDDYSDTGVLLRVSCHGVEIAGTGNGTGTASAIATYGHLGVGASSYAAAPGPTGYADVHSGAYADFHDMVAIVGSNGESGMALLTFSVDLRANLVNTYSSPVVGSQGAGSGGVDARISIGQTNFRLTWYDGTVARHTVAGIENSRSFSATINGEEVASILGTNTFTVPVVVGEYMQISAHLEGHTYAQGVSYGSGSATLDMMHSLAWAGVQSVSFEGSDIAFSVQSDSGTNWQNSFAAPVPEPSAYALMAAGICLIGAKCRRKKPPSITKQ